MEKKLRSFGTWGSNDENFNNPRGIALDDSGNIMVADHGNNRIQMFTQNGKFLKAVTTKGSENLLSKFNGCNTVAFNTCNQRFYVIDADGDIQILDSQLNFFGQFGGKAGALKYKDGKFSPATWGIGCDKAGQVYVADSTRNHIQVFSAEGMFLGVIGRGIFKSPTGIAFDARNMYVIYYNSHCLSVIDHTDNYKRVKAVGSRGKGKWEFNGPLGITVDEYNIVYICDSKNNRICLY